MLDDKPSHIRSNSQGQGRQDLAADAKDSSRGGRPRLKRRERRSYKYTVSVNVREREVIEANARRAGLTPSAYLREAGRGARLGRRANRQAVYQLSRIGVYLRAVGERPENAPSREDLEQVLQTIRRAIEEL